LNELQEQTDEHQQAPRRRRRKPERFVDLHVHTTFSDGFLTPTEAVKLAGAAKMKAVAITDHDTIDGVPEALSQGTRSRIEVIPGVEIGCETPQGTMDILGYYVDIASPTLEHRLRWMREKRLERIPRILDKLHDLGIDVSLDEVLEIADEGSVGRPHVARAIVRKGYAKTIGDAFDRCLGRHSPAYVSRNRIGPAAAIEIIRNAGGVPVLAHPTTLKAGTGSQLDVIVARLVREGLLGMEILHSDYDAHTSTNLRRLAEKHNILVTGGSDFHGDPDSGISVGTGTGELRVPYRYAQQLKAAAGTSRHQKAVEIAMT